MSTQDLHDLKPLVTLPIKWVGVKNLEFVGRFKSPFKEGPPEVSLNCVISLYTNLNKERRGVHMSYILETLLNEIMSKPKSILDFCRIIAEKIRTNQKQDYGRVKIICKHNLERKSPIIQLPTFLPVKIGADVVVDSSRTIYESFLQTEIIMVCPCLLIERNFSHTQRGTIRLTVISDKRINYSALLSTVEKICQPVSTTLRHPDEIHMVETSYKKAAFCEDIARGTLADLVQRFKAMYSKTTILKLKVLVKSDESIHPFSISAYAEQILK
jgi:GTP cyclohydrolase FolE2